MGFRILKRVLAVGLAVVLAAAAIGCGSSDKTSSSTTTGATQPGKGRPAITMGAKNFTEEFILGQLYAQALQAKGYTVNLKNNLGSSEIVDKALTSGQIDMYPEYTGVILAEIAKQNRTPESARAAYDAAKRFEESRGFTMLAPTPFFDTDALATLPDYARRNGLREIGDLKKLGSNVTLGAPPEFRTRLQGLVGLQRTYGLTELRFTPLSIGLQYKALDSGSVQVADVFTTDGQLQGGRYVVLKDPRNVFGFQNVAPVVNRNLLAREGPEFAKVLDAVSARLTTEAMQKMNAAVDLNKNDPAQVASRFLSANGLK